MRQRPERERNQEGKQEEVSTSANVPMIKVYRMKFLRLNADQGRWGFILEYYRRDGAMEPYVVYTAEPPWPEETSFFLQILASSGPQRSLLHLIEDYGIWIEDTYLSPLVVDQIALDAGYRGVQEIINVYHSYRSPRFDDDDFNDDEFEGFDEDIDQDSVQASMLGMTLDQYREWRGIMNAEANAEREWQSLDETEQQQIMRGYSSEDERHPQQSTHWGGYASTPVSDAGMSPKDIFRTWCHSCQLTFQKCAFYQNLEEGHSLAMSRFRDHLLTYDKVLVEELPPIDSAVINYLNFIGEARNAALITTQRVRKRVLTEEEQAWMTRCEELFLSCPSYTGLETTDQSAALKAYQRHLVTFLGYTDKNTPESALEGFIRWSQEQQQAIAPLSTKPDESGVSPWEKAVVANFQVTHYYLHLLASQREEAVTKFREFISGHVGKDPEHICRQYFVALAKSVQVTKQQSTAQLGPYVPVQNSRLTPEVENEAVSCGKGCWENRLHPQSPVNVQAASQRPDL